MTGEKFTSDPPKTETRYNPSYGIITFYSYNFEAIYDLLGWKNRCSG